MNKDKLSALLDYGRRLPWWGKLAGALVALLALGYLSGWGRGGSENADMVYRVKRGDLPIKVMEGGNVEALETLEIRSEIEGYQGTKILSIVEEGYQVTEKDITDRKLLVELDSSEIRKRLVSQEIQFQSTIAELTEERNERDIQVSQNLSDIKAAELKMKFARMDLEKYLGAEVIEELVGRLGLKEPERVDVTELPEGLDIKIAPSVTPETTSEWSGEPSVSMIGQEVPLEAQGVPESPSPPNLGAIDLSTSFTEELLRPTTVIVDYSEYADSEKLGDGEAQQKIREMEDKWLVAKTDLRLAQTQLDGTRRLFEKGFVTQNQLENDEVRVEKVQVEVKSTDTARRLFKVYEFPKTAEELVSNYEEAILALDKTQKEAISKLTKAETGFRSALGRFNIEKNELEELRDQLSKTRIYAQKTGLVTYGSNDGERYYRDEHIREGATVRERQVILTIPDLREMGVQVKIHESYIKQIKKDMFADIRVESFPDRPIRGKVTNVAILPDSSNRWMNPNLKVYKTTIRIEGVHDWLKPGMTAKVEILVNELKDVIYVPIQAVFVENNEQVCYLMNRSAERRPVKTGEYNDEYIQILEGLEAGDQVALKAPSPGQGGESRSADGRQANSGRASDRNRS